MLEGNYPHWWTFALEKWETVVPLSLSDSNRIDEDFTANHVRPELQKRFLKRSGPKKRKVNERYFKAHSNLPRSTAPSALFGNGPVIVSVSYYLWPEPISFRLSGRSIELPLIFFENCETIAKIESPSPFRYLYIISEFASILAFETIPNSEIYKKISPRNIRRMMVAG